MKKTMEETIKWIVESVKDSSVQIAGNLRRCTIEYEGETISEYYVDDDDKIYSLSEDETTGEPKVTVQWT